MEVTYTTTLDDYAEYGMHTLRRSPSMKWRFGLSWALVPLASWVAAALFNTRIPGTARTLAIGGLIYAIFFPFLYRTLVRSSMRAYARDLGERGVIGRITLVLADDTLTERTETVQSVARWQDMRGVEVVGDCTYVYVTGLLAAIIPRHGFERSEDYEAVRDFALAKITGQAEPDAVTDAASL